MYFIWLHGFKMEQKVILCNTSDGIWYVGLHMHFSERCFNKFFFFSFPFLLQGIQQVRDCTITIQIGNCSMAHRATCRKFQKIYSLLSFLFLFSITFPFVSCNLAVLETGASMLSHSCHTHVTKLTNTQMPHVSSLLLLPY